MIIALSSWWVAARPSTFELDPPAVIGIFPLGGAVPRVCYYIGLAIVVVTWLAIGRWLLVHGRPLRPRELLRYVLSVSAPLLVAAPIASRDLWAYAAQGNMMVLGVNPYRFGPFSAPGIFTNEMSPRWVFSPAPYGPLWMQIAHAIVGVSGHHPTVAVLLLRLPALVGVLLAAWTLPPIARRMGGRTELALWLGVASPLTLVLGVGGGHNDLLMAGLLVAGLAVVCQGSWTALAVGSAILGAASVVKTPAVAGLAFAVPIWLHVRQPHRRGFPPVRTIVSSSAVAGAVGLATMTIVSVGSGLGWAWLHEISSDISVVNWLSVPTAIAILLKLATGHVTGATRSRRRYAVHQITRKCTHRGRARGVVVRGASSCPIDLPGHRIGCRCVARSRRAALVLLLGTRPRRPRRDPPLGMDRAHDHDREQCHHDPPQRGRPSDGPLRDQHHRGLRRRVLASPAGPGRRPHRRQRRTTTVPSTPGPK